MSPEKTELMLRRLGLAFGVLGLALLAPIIVRANVAPPKEPPEAAIVKPGRVGELKIGATVKSLRRDDLIGPLKKGCELAPGQRVAKLVPPLEGTAVFGSPQKRNRLAVVVVEGGAETARGITIGSSARQVRKAYPKADYDPPGEVPPFAEGFVWVHNEVDPKMTFVLDPKSRRVGSIGVPAPSFCE